MIRADVLGRDRMLELRKRSMGELALRILSHMADNNLVAIEDTVGDKLSFYTVPELKRYRFLRSEERLRANKAMAALAVRGYLAGGGFGAEEPDEKAVDGYKYNQLLINWINERVQDTDKVRRMYSAWDKCPPEIENFKVVPWQNFGRCIMLSREGREAVLSLSKQISLMQKKEREQNNKPRFVVTRLTDSSGNNRGGACAVYRIQREAGNKVWIVNPLPEDGAPKPQFKDNAVEKVEKDYSTVARYIKDENILAKDITMDQATRLIQATVLHQETIQDARKKLEDAVAPLEEKYEREKTSSFRNMEEVIQRINQESHHLQEQSHLPDREDDEFVLGDDDLEEGGFKP